MIGKYLRVNKERALSGCLFYCNFYFTFLIVYSNERKLVGLVTARRTVQYEFTCTKIP